MAIWAFPFVSVNKDRAYGPADLMQFYANIFSTGIVPNTALPGYTGFQVLQASTPSLNITVGSGVAIIGGGQIMNTAPKSFKIPVPLTTQARTDSIVIQWNNSSRLGDILYKQNSTQVVQTADVYELQIAKILVPANAASIPQANITDMRADEKVCGYSSPFEAIKTGDLLAQFKSQLEENGIVFSEWFATVKADLQVELTNMENFLDTSKADLQSWVDSVKDVIEAVDPGGQLLAELTDLKQKTEKYIPTGFTFILEHDSEYQPEVKVTSYKNALGTEVNGLGTGPVFGRERLYNVPVSLSYDRKKAYVEMPISYKIDGNITIVDGGKALMIIDKPQTLCFEMSGTKITRGYKA